MTSPDQGQSPPRTEGAPGGELEALYRTQSPRLMGYFQRHLGSAEDIRDLVQESFLRFARAGRTRELAEPAAFLRRIARNLLFDRSRQRAARSTALHTEFDEDKHGETPPGQCEALEVSELLDVYRRALHELPDRTRRVFLLHRVQDLTYREIGERLGLSIPTVQYHVARALSHLARSLDEECGG